MPNMQKQMEAEELKTCAIVRKSQNQEEDEVYDLWHIHDTMHYYPNEFRFFVSRFLDF